jgi:hypothetical protein
MFNNEAESGEMNVEHLQNTALNVVEMICGVVSCPVEMILRPWYGTRYFPVPVVFGSGVLMLLLPGIALLFTSVVQMIPFARYAAPPGLFDFASLTKLYFLLSIVHGIRLWRRMIHMEREQHSRYEGPALPFFAFLPKSDSFWFTRIVLEPCFVFLAAIVLQDLFIVQSGLGIYLQVAGLALGLKNFVSWFRSWEYLRQVLDMRIGGPVIAKLVDNKATDEDLAPMHLASFPKDLDPAIRRAAAAHIARAFAPETILTPHQEDEVHGAD